MPDLDHFHELQDLGENLRLIEEVTSKATEIVVVNGEKRYLVGDLRERSGRYEISMKDKYYLFDKIVENEYKNLEGFYDSFVDLKKVVESEGGRLRILERGGIGMPSFNMGRAGGQTYAYIGRIVFPLLRDDEGIKVSEER